MKTIVSLHDFRDAFAGCNRKDQFSYEGLEALYNWLIDIEEDSGEEWELDVIALCCEYAEYKNLAEFQQDYNAEDYASLDDITEQTTVIPINKESFIIQQF